MARSRKSKLPPPAAPDQSARPAAVLQPPHPVAGILRQALRAHWRWVLGLWLVCLLAYANSFRSGMVYDNAIVLLKDARIQAATAQNLHLIFNEEYWYGNASTGLYRPLTTLSYLFNYAVLGNGPNPAGYHWVNFALHGLNVSLVYILGVLLFGEAAAAVALAALWGVHPLLTEAVTNIVGRADLLATFGVLAGLLCHILSASAGGRRKNVLRAGVLVFAALGIFSKENAAVLPGLMLLYDLAWSKRAAWRERLPGYIAVLVPFALYLNWRVQMQARIPLPLIPFGDNPLVDAGFWTARLTAIKVIGKYLWLALWPARLSADHSFNDVPLFGWRFASWEDAQAVLALLACLALVALAVRVYRTDKPLFFFVFFFFVALAPTSNVFVLNGSIMAERFLYLPAIGLAGCLVAAAAALGWRWRSRAAWAAVSLVCLAFAARTFARNRDWLDERSIWASAVAVSPASFKAHWQYAVSLADSGPSYYDQAVREADATAAILAPLSPDQQTPMPYADMGFCYRLKGDSAPEAQRKYWYGKALDALLRGQQVDKVVTEQIRQANLAAGKNAVLRSWTSLYLELGRTYARLSNPDKALEALASGRSRRADSAFSEEMARVWLAQKDWQHAAVALMEGLVIDPDATALAGELRELYSREAPESCAVTKATSINMACPLVHDQLCSASRNVWAAYNGSQAARQARATAATAIQSFGCPAEAFR